MEKKLTQVKVGTVLGLTTRHIQRPSSGWSRRATRGWSIGDGVPSNRWISEAVKAKALTHLRRKVMVAHIVRLLYIIK